MAERLENPIDLTGVFDSSSTNPHSLEDLNQQIKNQLKAEDAPRRQQLNSKDLQTFIESLEKTYGTSQAGFSLLRQGYAAPRVVEHNSNELLWAAAQKDTATLQKLLLLNLDINVQNTFGATPLHIAAYNGNAEGVSLLLQRGANDSIPAYNKNGGTSITAIELALEQGHEDVILTMLHFHAFGGFEAYEVFDMAVMANLNTVVTEMIQNDILDECPPLLAETLLWSTLSDLINALEDYNPDTDYDSIKNSFQTLHLLVEHVNTVFISDEFDDQGLPPLGFFLDALASMCELPESQSLFQQEADFVNGLDANTEHYLQAKLLFHIVPIEGDYKINLNNHVTGATQQAFVTAEGLHNYFTVKHAYSAVSDYSNTHDFQNASEQAAFDDASKSLKLASDLAVKQGLMSSAHTFYDSYQNGETVLLASGWEGHAVDILINKSQQLLIIANNGQRYDDVSSGVSIFKMANPDSVTPQLIHEILVNQEQVDLELKLSLKLGLQNLDVINELDQFTGNCAWQSQESALEGLLFISLLEQGISFETALSQAHSHYQEWDNFQTLHFVENYFSNDPRIEADAVESLIKTQAFLLGTDDIMDLKQDPVGKVLIEAYEYHYSKNANYIELDYDPFNGISVSEMLASYGNTEPVKSILPMYEVLSDQSSDFGTLHIETQYDTSPMPLLATLDPLQAHETPEFAWF